MNLSDEQLRMPAGRLFKTATEECLKPRKAKTVLDRWHCSSPWQTNEADVEVDRNQSIPWCNRVNQCAIYFIILLLFCSGTAMTQLHWGLLAAFSAFLRQFCFDKKFVNGVHWTGRLGRPLSDTVTCCVAASCWMLFNVSETNTA